MLSLRCQYSQYITTQQTLLTPLVISTTWRFVHTCEWPWNHRVRTETKRQDRKLVTGHYTINDGNQFPGAPFDVTDRFILWHCLFSQTVWMSRFREARRPAKSPKHFLLALALLFMPEKTRIHNCTTIQNNDAIKLHIIYHRTSGIEIEKQACNVY